MAIQKNFEIKNSGLEASYSIIDNVTLSRDVKTNSYTLLICYALYKDDVARIEGKEPIDIHSIQISGEAAIESVMAVGYSELKKLEKFTGAIDV